MEFISYLCLETGRCRCYGDPHCYRFDMKDQDKDMFVVGSCVRTLVYDFCPWAENANQWPTVHITATFQRKKPRSPRSFVKDVMIDMFNLETSYVSNFCVSFTYCKDISMREQWT